MQKCNEGYELASNNLCLEVHENPYTSKLVDLLMEMDRGFLRGRTFLDYGAHHSHRMNGKELLVSVINGFDS
jgi:hypothetical protein